MKMVKMVCRYDNAWGYFCHVADLANHIVGKGGF
jgi:glyceraldehyde-3-phosphate dehydrogenase/erythrose-4-phosphate dehydrogenase